MWLVLGLQAALAYESDTLTDRTEPLPDVTEALDAEVQLALAEAIGHTNERLKCRVDEKRTKKVLADALWRRLAVNELVSERGGLRALGFDRYAAWIEKGGVPHRSFDDRTHMFGSLALLQSPVLNVVGVCSTVRINDHLVGTDKLDHFFEEGYHAWRRASRKGEEKAIAWTTRTENTVYGLDTSQTFSWSDLRADYDGMHFYDSLLEPDSVAVLDDQGCVIPGKPFTWRDWVTWEYDEVLNPPVYTPATQRGVERHLEANREAYCEEYAVWGGEAYQAHLEQVLAAEVVYASEQAPERYDPYELDELCAEAVPPETPAD